MFGVEREKVSRVREPILEREFQIVKETAFAGGVIEAVNVSGTRELLAGTVFKN